MPSALEQCKLLRLVRERVIQDRQKQRRAQFINRTPISSNPLHSIHTFGSPLSLKNSDNTRMYFENFNGLPLSPPAWRATLKHKLLCQTTCIMHADTIVITEIQINPSLLLNSKVVHNGLFRADHHVDAMANNSNDLTGRRNKVVTSLRL